MSTTAQINANQANSQLSTGPTTIEGKAAVAQNRTTHGLTGTFRLLPTEDAGQFQELIQSLYTEHQPATATESRLVELVARHFWLMQRALTLQDDLLVTPDLDHKTFSLYLRYQTTNERAYYKATNELRNIRKEKRQQEIGFESQKRSAEQEAQKEARRSAQESRKAADEIRKQEHHETRLRLMNARAAYSELDTHLKGTMEAPLPGNIRLPLEDLADAFCLTFKNVNKDLLAELSIRNAA